MSFRDTVSKMVREPKRLVILCAAVALGVLLICLPTGASDGAEVEREETLEEYGARLESELADTCAQIEGVGRCRVMLTFERGAENTYKGSQLTESKPPRVLGVCIVCEGAGSASVRAQLTQMICALFDVGTNRVSVAQMRD